MRKHLLPLLLALGLMPSLHAAKTDDFAAFHFAIIDQHSASISSHPDADLARPPEKSVFGVVNGIRLRGAPCTDEVYQQQKNLLEKAAHPIIVVPAGSDWIGCRNENGEDIRIERLQRLRELLFVDDNSFGTRAIPLHRQSLSAKFRDFPENTYWQHEAILFATMHLPADNNHYLSAAGRNNEFEERLVASHDWLQRIFTLAKRGKLPGIVIFCDGNPLEIHAPRKNAPRDGFKEIRQWLTELSSHYPGKVLIVHGQPGRAKPAIAWKNNLGVAGAGARWLDIGVSPKSRNLFFISEPPATPKKKRR